MQLSNYLSLLGGLALFLYGMQMMSDGLEDAAGNKMKTILEKLTANRFMAILVGAGITAVIQSSSATTVMVVGFVNSGIMNLGQALWIIMGANIGTTVTGQLISLKVSAIAPVLAFFGVVFISFFRNPKLRHSGKIIAGLGILFIGMNMMGDAMKPLRSSGEFIAVMTTFSNPVFGIVAGALFTAIIQSSSASIGILQTLASEGLIAFQSSVFVLFGQNIGTCITAVIASIGTNKNAKRATTVHLLFNVIGTVIFTIAVIISPIEEFIASLTPDNPAAQIANMHTFFNIATTLMLIPCGNMLTAIARKVIPDKDVIEQPRDILVEPHTSRTHLGFSAIHTDTLIQEVGRMSRLADENLARCFEALIKRDDTFLGIIDETEEAIDILNKNIALYISRTLASGDSHSIASVEEYYSIAGNIERIGDHAHNIGGYIRKIKEKNITFSSDAISEIENMKNTSLSAMKEVLSGKDNATRQWLGKIEAIEENFDEMTEKFREGHILRMKKGLCTEEGAIMYSDLLTDFERIGDHLLNIAESYEKIYATSNM